MSDLKVQIARAIADQLGYDYDRVFEHKQEWVAEGGFRGGQFHDVNEPYRCDFDCAADAVLSTIAETHVVVPLYPRTPQLDAGIRAMDMAVSPTSRVAFRRAYRAMLASSQQGGE